MAFSLFPCRSECKKTVGKSKATDFKNCVDTCRQQKKASKNGDAEFDKALSLLSQDTSSGKSTGISTGMVLGILGIVVLAAVLFFVMSKRKKATT